MSLKYAWSLLRQFRRHISFFTFLSSLQSRSNNSLNFWLLEYYLLYKALPYTRCIQIVNLDPLFVRKEVLYCCKRLFLFSEIRVHDECWLMPPLALLISSCVAQRLWTSRGRVKISCNIWCFHWHSDVVLIEVQLNVNTIAVGKLYYHSRMQSHLDFI